MMHPHEQEERDFGHGPLLWDARVATGEVCCAAFQLGACAHTEAFHEDEVWDIDEDGEPYLVAVDDVVVAVVHKIDLAEEPF